MNRPEELTLLRDALLTLPDKATVTPECLDDEMVAAFAEARLDDAARSAAMLHLASCPRCRRAVVSLSRALADRAVAREVNRADTGRGRFHRILVPLAAAAVLLVFIRPSSLTDIDPRHRAPISGSGAAPVPAAPIGAVEAARALRWRTVAGADRYRVTLFAEGGAVLYEAQLADSMLSLPDSIVLVSARRYFWKVEARTGFDRWVTSGLVEFTIVADTPR